MLEAQKFIIIQSVSRDNDAPRQCRAAAIVRGHNQAPRQRASMPTSCQVLSIYSLGRYKLARSIIMLRPFRLADVSLPACHLRVMSDACTD